MLLSLCSKCRCWHSDGCCSYYGSHSCSVWFSCFVLVLALAFVSCVLLVLLLLLLVLLLVLLLLVLLLVFLLVLTLEFVVAFDVVTIAAAPPHPAEQ